jgi:hypothetical protein
MNKTSMKTGSIEKRNPDPPVFELVPPATTHPPRATDAHNATLAAASGLAPFVLVLPICGVLVAEDVVTERTEVGPQVRRLRALGNPMKRSRNDVTVRVGPSCCAHRTLRRHV